MTKGGHIRFLKISQFARESVSGGRGEINWKIEQMKQGWAQIKPTNQGGYEAYLAWPGWVQKRREIYGAQSAIKTIWGGEDSKLGAGG